MRYLLKIFSGPHVGAEVVLAEGETTIGSSEDCDLVLDDRLVAAQHASVSIENDTITCKPLGDAVVLIDGKAIEPSTIRPFQYFTLGTTHVAVGPADKPWPHFDLSDFQLRIPVEDDQPNESAASEETEANAETEASQAVAAATPSEPTSKGALGWPFSITAIAALIIVGLNALVLIAAVTYSSLDSSESAGVTEDADLAETNQVRLRKELGQFLPHIAIEDHNGRCYVKGYVPSDTSKDTLVQLARQIDPAVIVNVRSTESLLQSVEKRLTDDGWSGYLMASGEAPGVVRIKGQLARDADARKRWRLTADRIEKDIPLRELLVDLEAPQSPLTTTTHQVAVLRTPVAPVDSAHRVRRTRPLSILDVRVSHDKIVTLADGRQVSIGGRLLDNLKVEDINLNHANVRGPSGQQLVVPFGF